MWQPEPRRLARQRPCVANFFRFAGCPACNIALPYYQRQLYPQLQALGVPLVAVSPQMPVELVEIKTRHNLELQVASDPENQLGRRLVIPYSFDEASRKATLAKGSGIGELSDTQRVISTPGVVVTTRSENSHLPSVDEAAAGPPSSESRPQSTETRTQTETAREALLTPPETNVVSAVSPPSRVQQIREQIDRETSTEAVPTIEACAIDDIWTIASPLNTPEQLRLTIAGLAREMASYAGHPESIIDQQHGLGFALDMERVDLATPRSTGVHLLLLALMRAQDEVNWEDRKQLPSALFGQLLLGIYQLPLPDHPVMDVGLERLPDSLLIKLYRLTRHDPLIVPKARSRSTPFPKTRH